MRLSLLLVLVIVCTLCLSVPVTSRRPTLNKLQSLIRPAKSTQPAYIEEVDAPFTVGSILPFRDANDVAAADAETQSVVSAVESSAITELKHAKTTAQKHYGVASILPWRSIADQRAAAKNAKVQSESEVASTLWLAAD